MSVSTGHDSGVGLPRSAVATLAGGYIFVLGVAAGQLAGFAAGLSCAVPLASSVAGATVVSCAAVASCSVALNISGSSSSSSQAVSSASPAADSFVRDGSSGFHERRISALLSLEDVASAVSCTAGKYFDASGPSVEQLWWASAALAVYRLLGGRFAAVMPSDLLKPGAFARESLPAGRRYANTAQRQEVVRIGRSRGCHSCGSRRPGASGFHADHMPPSKLRAVREAKLPLRIFNMQVPQVFLPQCAQCSALQAFAARQWNSMSLRRHAALRLHIAALRPYHLTGIVVCAGVLAGVPTNARTH